MAANPIQDPSKKPKGPANDLVSHLQKQLGTSAPKDSDEASEFLKQLARQQFEGGSGLGKVV